MLLNHFILENKKVPAPSPLSILGKGTDTSALPPLFISFVQKDTSTVQKLYPAIYRLQSV